MENLYPISLECDCPQNGINTFFKEVAVMTKYRKILRLKRYLCTTIYNMMRKVMKSGNLESDEKHCGQMMKLKWRVSAV